MWAAFLIASFVYAQEPLETQFKGRFRSLHHPKEGVMIHPDHLKFRYCKKAMIRKQTFIENRNQEAYGLKQSEKAFTLETWGDPNNPKCLTRGIHECTLTLNHWSDQAQQLKLMVSCDDSNWVKLYEKRVWEPRKKKRRH